MRISFVAGLSVVLVGYIIAVLNHAIPPWLTICLVPFALLAALIIFLMVMANPGNGKETLLRESGIETEGTIIKAELYSGDGLNPGDPCYKGQFEFYDRQNQRHIYSFYGYCYDPYDLLAGNSSLEFPLEQYFREGSKGKVVYLEHDASVHIFYGPKLTFVSKTE